MKLLLDTHVWLWTIFEPAKISRRTSREMSSLQNELWLSPVSIWEVGLLLDAGKFGVKGSVAAWFEDVLANNALIEAPLTHRVALEARAVGLPHNDPGDRFLAATAKVYDLVLVTADKKLLAGRGFKTLEA